MAKYLNDGINLLDYQQNAVNKYLNCGYGSFGLFMRQGTGKSITSMSMGLSKIVSGEVDYIQIICPSGLRTNWLMEIKKFIKPEFHDKFLPLVTYRDLSYRKDIPTSKRTLLLLDESHNIKNPQSKSTQYYFDLLDQFYGALLLSGTPLTNSGLDMYVPAKTLGYSEGIMKFIEDHCYEKLMKRGKMHFYVYTPEIKNADKLKEKISPYCVWIDDRVVLTLPEQTYVKKYYAINKKQRLLLKVAEGKLKEESIKSNIPEVKLLEKHLPAIQLLLDGLMVENGKLKTISTEKIELLIELIQDLPENEQLIIFCVYHYEIDQISAALDKAKLSYVLRTGKSNQSEKDKAVEDFTSNKVKILLGTTSANSEGLNLTNCSKIIYYSRDFGLKQYAQSLKRIHRIGQEKDCTYYFLMSADLDDNKYSALDSAVDSILNVKEEVLEDLYSSK